MIDLTKLPTDPTEEEYRQIAPAILQHILSGTYTAGVDEILEWDITDSIATGKFADTKGATRKVFSFKYDMNTYDLEMFALEGVED